MGAEYLLITGHMTLMLYVIPLKGSQTIKLYQCPLTAPVVISY
jgi:hypothetical protein